MEQPALFAVAPKLTDRQQLVYDAIRAAGPEGLRADEAGAILHERRLELDGRGWSGNGRHDAGTRCDYCARDGRGVLRSAALKELVTRKRHGGWVPRDPRERDQPSSQTDAIPF